jgi:hypothetical protein
VFTPEERGQLRSELLDLARSDPRITGGAITGSAAAEREDAWSDIDLAFGVRSAAEVPGVLQHLSAHMYARHGALHQLDLPRGAWIYRVFLLPSTLQVDLAFAPADEFGALAPTFRLVFGEARPAKDATVPNTADLIGWAWLYALHARSCIARGKVWQAEYMISGIRDQVLALACVRLGLPAAYGRGMDRLPIEVTTPLRGALVRSLDPLELRRAMGVVTEALLREIDAVDRDMAARLRDVLHDLVTTAGS